MEMTIQDTSVEKEKSRSVRPAQQDQEPPPVGRETVGHSYQKQPSEDSAEHPEGNLHTVRSNKLEQFGIMLIQKMTRSDSTWITISSIMQWLKLANRVRPCRLLSRQ